MVRFYDLDHKISRSVRISSLWEEKIVFEMDMPVEIGRAFLELLKEEAVGHAGVLGRGKVIGEAPDPVL